MLCSLLSRFLNLGVESRGIGTGPSILVKHYSAHVFSATRKVPECYRQVSDLEVEKTK